MEQLFEEMKNSVLEGEEEEAAELAQKALDSGMDPVAVMDKGFLKGINEAGKLYEEGEFFLPELVCAADAMKAALEVLDEELKIPEKVLHYAKIGEEYQPLIEQFKVKMAIDEGVLTDEVKSILKEAKEEIQSLKSELNKATAEKMELTEDAKEMAVHIYLRKKCDGLVEA